MGCKVIGEAAEDPEVACFILTMWDVKTDFRDYTSFAKKGFILTMWDVKCKRRGIKLSAYSSFILTMWDVKPLPPVPNPPSLPVLY